jgi:glucokinase
LPPGVAVGVDVGGTKLVAGLVGADGSVLARRRETTPAHDPQAIPSLIARMARELTGEPAPVGIGAAGIVDIEGVVRYGPNIDWVDFPLRDLVAALIGGTVTVDNDANAAAWGEYRAGAAAGAASMVMLTVGTGVGGGLVLDGRLVRGRHGLGAEFGHIIVLEGGPPCPCGNRGCLEAVASGTAIGRLARERLGWADATGKSVTEAAQAGDGQATAVVTECGFWLGVGIASLVNALDPDLVVVGGGAMQAGELLLGPARDACAERLVGRGSRPHPPVVEAALGDDAGVVGAGLLALEVSYSSR